MLDGAENVDLIDKSTAISEPQNNFIGANGSNFKEPCNSSSSKSPMGSTKPESNITTPYSFQENKFSSSNYMSP